MKRVIKSCVGLFSVFAIFSSLAFAESEVLTSEGKYVMGDLDTKKDARALALMEAKRFVLEKAGTYLESSSEVKNYELTKDEITSLASGIMSVELLREDWKMSGENLMVTVLIRATVDTSNLEERISTLKNDTESVEELKDIQAQVAALQEELQALKAQSTKAVSDEQGEAPKKELKEKYVALIDRMSALDYLKSANADLANRRWEEALSHYDQALSVNPAMAEAYAGQAMALNRMGEPDEALKKIDKAIDLAPGSARAHGVKAFILTRLHKYASALESVNKAIEIDPQNPRLHFGRGEINLKLQRPRRAFKDFERACRMGNRKACERTKALAQRSRIRQKSHQMPGSSRMPRPPR